MTKNKIGTYLLYAIGEIVLVVAGILIAVQIDQWNTDKQNLKKIVVLLEDYKNDLLQDKTYLKSNIQKQEERIEQALLLVDRIKGPNISFDSIKHIAEFEHSPLINSVTTFNNNTFNSMINSGSMEMLDEQLKKRMLDLDKIQRTTSSGNLHDLYTFAASTYMNKFPLGVRQDGRGYLHDIVWDIQDERVFVTQFYNMSMLRIRYLQSQNKILEEIMKKTNELIEIINNHKQNKTP